MDNDDETRVPRMTEVGETQAAREERHARAIETSNRFLANVETVVHGKRTRDRARPRRARVWRPRPARGRSRHGQDDARPRDRAARSRARRRPASSARRTCSRPTSTGLSVYNQRERDFEFRAGPDLRERRPRRRDQPRDAEDAVGAARGDGRAPGHGRRRDAPAARSRSSCSRPRTRSSTRARSRSPRRSSTASSCARRSATRGSRTSCAIVQRAAARPSARPARAGCRSTEMHELQRGRRRRSTSTTCSSSAGSSTSSAPPASSTTSRSAPRCAARSRSSGRRARGRSCRAATTSCRRTSSCSSCRSLDAPDRFRAGFLAEAAPHRLAAPRSSAFQEGVPGARAAARASRRPAALAGPHDGDRPAVA